MTIDVHAETLDVIASLQMLRPLVVNALLVTTMIFFVIYALSSGCSATLHAWRLHRNVAAVVHLGIVVVALVTVLLSVAVAFEVSNNWIMLAGTYLVSQFIGLVIERARAYELGMYLAAVDSAAFIRLPLLANASGRVHAVGASRSVLRLTDGSLLHVPNDQFAVFVESSRAPASFAAAAAAVDDDVDDDDAAVASGANEL